MEGSTLLAAIGAARELTLGLLVGSVTYEPPPGSQYHHHAGHHLRRARVARVGAGWFEQSTRPTATSSPAQVPVREVEEHLQIVGPCSPRTSPRSRASTSAFEEPYNNPKPSGATIPIVIGGSGERQDATGSSPSTPTAATSSATRPGPPSDRRPGGPLRERRARPLRDHQDRAQPGADRRQSGGGGQDAPGGARAGCSPGAPGHDDDRRSRRRGRASPGVRRAGLDGMAISLPNVHDTGSLELAGRAFSSAVQRAPVA